MSAFVASYYWQHRAGDIVRLSCEKCGRSGQYRKQKLITRYGADMRLPDLREEIAQCERPVGRWDLLIASLLPGAAVALTRHELTDAISTAEAERKDYQIDNDVWHVRCTYHPGR